MKTVALVVLLVAGVSAQYFCPATEAELQCIETMADVAFCMDDGTWNCGKCDTKRDVCFNKLKIARFESTCTRAGNAKPDCLSAA
ncbi:hypothetical protein V1264_015216 [Littorina saxatilis]|uniref:Uncharacterized protein n=1 Tax=Littorina saxatilis TaxID=31220 RepID=A0AAN9GGI6_9CAEN